MEITPASPVPENISAVILAGGRGQRMGDQDKGLIELDGKPLVAHTLERLQQQTQKIFISANRNLEQYRQLGVEVIRDEHDDFPGPLAGIYSALCHIKTDWLLSLPVDSPLFPADLLPRFIQALTEQPATIAVARDEKYMQPVFNLVHRSLKDDLKTFLDNDERKTGYWIRQHQPVEVMFNSHSMAFFNINTTEDLLQFKQQKELL